MYVEGQLEEMENLTESAEGLHLVELSMVTTVLCSTLLCLTFLFGTVANILIIGVIAVCKSLRTALYAPLVSLAIADLFVCMFSTPLILTILICTQSGIQIPKELCTTQNFFHIVGEMAQLMTLAAISIERYQAVAKPFERKERTRRVKAVVVITWSISILIWSLAISLLNADTVNIACLSQRSSHEQHYNTYGVYLLSPLTLLTMILICVLYARINILVRNKRPPGTTVPNKNQIVPMNEHRGLSRSTCELKTNSAGTPCTQDSLPSIGLTASNKRVELTPLSVKAEKSNVASVSSLPIPSEAGVSMQKQASSKGEGSVNRENKSSLSNNKVLSIRVVDFDGKESVAKGTTDDQIYGSVCLMDTSNRVRSKRQMENKLAKMAGLVILVFLCLWLPQPIAMCIHALNIQESISKNMSELELILAVTASCGTFINPIIYVAINKKIRAEVVKRFKSRFCFTNIGNTTLLRN